MIIWSRWGIVVLLFVGLGVALGFGIGAALGLIQPSGPVNGVFVGIGLMLSGAILWVFTKVVVGRHIDKPVAAAVWEQLAEPTVDESGRPQTHRSIPLLHPETGQQIVTQPVSTFFFIPLRYWAFVLPAIGLLVLVINLIALANGG